MRLMSLPTFRLTDEAKLAVSTGILRTGGLAIRGSGAALDDVNAPDRPVTGLGTTGDGTSTMGEENR